MKPEDEIRELVGKSQVQVGSEADERILKGAFSELEKPGRVRVNVFKIILQSRISKLAAAAVIIVALGVAVVHLRPAEQVEAPMAVTTAESPAKMMSRLSLTLAYNRGGMEAVDEQYKKAFEKLGSKQEILSMAELLNGNGDS